MLTEQEQKEKDDKEKKDAESQDITESDIVDMSPEEVKEALAANKDAYDADDADPDEDDLDDVDPDGDDDKDPDDEDNEDDDKDPDDEDNKDDDEEDTRTDREKELEEERATLRAQLEDKEKFILKQGNELGDLRKGTKPAEENKAAPTAEELTRAHDNDPVATTKALIASAVAEERERVTNEENTNKARTELVKRAVLKAVPEFSELTEEIAALALADGYDAEAVEEFKTNAFDGGDHDILIGFGKRALLLRKLAASDKEIADLKKDPDSVVKKIEKASKEKPGLRGKKASSRSGEKGLTAEQISNLSRDELKALIKKDKEERS